MRVKCEGYMVGLYGGLYGRVIWKGYMEGLYGRVKCEGYMGGLNGPHN